MKKILVSLLTLAISVVCACAFIGCGNNEDGESKAAKWSGEVGNLPQAVENVIEIENGEQLSAFAVAVNGGNAFAGYTVKLTADINLDNIEWNPIGRVIGYPNASFAGVFDGDGHTIYNLKVASSGMIQNGTDYSTAGLFGSLVGTVKNLNLYKVNITSTHYAGAVVGYIGGSSNAQISNCTVDGGTITSTVVEHDNGDKVGGIIGYCNLGTVKDCTVKDITVKAYRDLGGIVGCADGQNTVIKNNAVGENVKVVVDNTDNYKNYTKNEDYNAGSIIGRCANGSASQDCVGIANITLPFES